MIAPRVDKPFMSSEKVDWAADAAAVDTTCFAPVEGWNKIVCSECIRENIC